MKPFISIVSECQSENLGDRAISEALSEILAQKYIVSRVPFGKINEGLSASQVRRTNSNSLRLLSGLMPRSKARIKWYLNEKRLFYSHYYDSIKKSDLIIIGGGQLVKNNVALFCEKINLVTNLSYLNKKPYGFIGVGVDKKLNKLNWLLLKTSIVNSSFNIFRDKLSISRVDNAVRNFKAHEVMPDLAFSIKNEGRIKDIDSRKVSIGVNIMDFSSMLSQSKNYKKYSFDNYLTELSALAKKTKNDGLNLQFFTSGTHQDLLTTIDIKKKIYDFYGIDVEIFHPATLKDLLLYLSDVKYVVATRMHAGILAYISGCNPLCISWDDKVLGVWSAINQKNRVMSLDDFFRKGAIENISKKLSKLETPTNDELDEIAYNIKSQVISRVDSSLTNFQYNDE